MLSDCHSHLADGELSSSLESLSHAIDARLLRVISNSVDAKSSQLNLALARSLGGVRAFVGIHPQVLFSGGRTIATYSSIELELNSISKMIDDASGVGEVGLDPTYGELGIQEFVFLKMLELAEKNDLPVAIHSRESVERCLDLISSFSLRRIMFHWFAGTESQMATLHGKGIYTSFGPPVLYSKRIQSLVSLGHKDLLLAETDSPLRFDSFGQGFTTTPLFVSSVVFRMASLLKCTFDEAEGLIDQNTLSFLADAKLIKVYPKGT